MTTTKAIKTTKQTKTSTKASTKTYSNDSQTTQQTTNENPKKNGINLDERNLGMYCHFAAFLGYFIPLGNVLGPLVIWLSKGEPYPFVDDQGKEALNFQMSMSLYILVSLALAYFFIGIPILIALVLFEFVVIIFAGVKAREGIAFRYPLSIRFVS